MPAIVALSGANGKMGKSIITAAAHHNDLVIVAALTNPPQLDLLYSQKIQVFIDFSRPAGTMEYLNICEKLKIPMVIGTTGFNLAQKEKIFNAALRIPIIFAPNMSIGANICNYMLACLSKLWSTNQHQQENILIKEVHHKHKLDAPSGTALKMADIIKKNSIGENGNTEIKFVSKRIGNVKGRHKVIFSDQAEEIIIAHNVKTRTVFADGALFAAKWLLTVKPGKVYGLLDVMNFTEILKTGLVF